MSDASGTSDDDGDYAYGDSHMVEAKRYPVHDSCEFDDVEDLRVSFLLTLKDDDVLTSSVDVLEGGCGFRGSFIGTAPNCVLLNQR